jgi:dethiobiotin synthetase
VTWPSTSGCRRWSRPGPARSTTLLTLEAARAAGLALAGVVMTPRPSEPDAVARSNRATVERLGAIPVAGLPPTRPEALAQAGGALPLADWLGSRQNGSR